MATGILQLSKLAGFAGLLNPSSNCTERLVKHHKRNVKLRFTCGFNEQKLKEEKRDHSGEELRNPTLLHSKKHWRWVHCHANSSVYKITTNMYKEIINET